MKIVLKDRVKGVGEAGDIIEVADGYARNYLLPRKLAVEATASTLKETEQRKIRQSERQQQENARARALATRLQGLRIEIPVRCGEQGKLFGSVTGKEISEVLKKEHGLDVDRRRLELAEPIKSVGTYNVTLRLPGSTQAVMEVVVRAE